MANFCSVALIILYDLILYDVSLLCHQMAHLSLASLGHVEV